MSETQELGANFESTNPTNQTPKKPRKRTKKPANIQQGTFCEILDEGDVTATTLNGGPEPK